LGDFCGDNRITALGPGHTNKEMGRGTKHVTRYTREFQVNIQPWVYDACPYPRNKSSIYISLEQKIIERIVAAEKIQLHYGHKHSTGYSTEIEDLALSHALALIEWCGASAHQFHD
jgi:hypothetical protein